MNISPLFSLSHALGRIGCLLAGCCFGASCDLPWAIAGRHPTALYLIVGEIFIYLFLVWREQKPFGLGTQFMAWILAHSVLRFIVESYRDDFRGEFLTLPLAGHISISQLLCLVFAVISASYLIWSGWLKKPYNHRPS